MSAKPPTVRAVSNYMNKQCLQLCHWRRQQAESACAVNPVHLLSWWCCRGDADADLCKPRRSVRLRFSCENMPVVSTQYSVPDRAVLLYYSTTVYSASYLRSRPAASAASPPPRTPGSLASRPALPSPWRTPGCRAQTSHCKNIHINTVVVWPPRTVKRVTGGLSCSDWEKSSRWFGLLGLRRVLGGLVCLD